MGKKILIAGAGGFAREALLHLNYSRDSECEYLFFDDVSDLRSLTVSGTEFRVVKDVAHLKEFNFCGFYIGVGSPKSKMILASKLVDVGLSPLPTYVHPAALIQDSANNLGLGGIICPGAKITTNVHLGDYVVLNLGVTIGHDVKIGGFSTINPNASISGNVSLGDGVMIGTGAAVIEKCDIPDWCVVGAGAVITKSFLVPGATIVGVPGKAL